MAVVSVIVCNQCLSPLMLWVRISIRARCTTLCDKVFQWFATGQGFFPGPLVSSTNKTDHHNITEILLKVALNTINQIYYSFLEKIFVFPNIKLWWQQSWISNWHKIHTFGRAISKTQGTFQPSLLFRLDKNRFMMLPWGFHVNFLLWWRPS